MKAIATLPVRPVALTIAGSDSGGGAGIQADLHTFAACGVHGTTAITCLTAQNPAGVRGIQPATPQFVGEQIAAVFAELPPRAVKTGMLFNRAIIVEVASCLETFGKPTLVVDPVMIATSGARLLERAAERALRDRVIPLATLVTPNVDEAQALTGIAIHSVEDLRGAARRIHETFGVVVLAKGGHLQGLREAVDILYDGEDEWLLSAPFVRGVSTHGTGCTYSAAITAHLARGLSLPKAVAEAKTFISTAIANHQRVARHSVLGW